MKKMLLIQALCVLLLLSACAKTAGNSENGAYVSAGISYGSKFTELPFRVSQIISDVITEDRIYILGTNEKGGETALFISDINGKAVSPKEGYRYDVAATEGVEAFRCAALAVDESEAPVLIWQSYAYGAGGAKLMCAKIADNGELSEERLLTEAIAPGAWIGKAAIGGDKRLYISNSGALEIYDESGKRAAGENLLAEDIFRLSNGSVAVLSDGALYTAEKNQTPQKSSVALRFGVNKLCPAGENAVLLSTDTGLWLYDMEYDMEKESEQKLLDFTEAEVNGSRVQDIKVLENGDILLLELDENAGKISIAALSPKKTDNTKEKTTLTLAVTSPENLDIDYIIDFNRNSKDYRIEAIYYSDFNTASDYTAGVRRLIFDITAGNVPDIFQLWNFPVETFAETGVFEELSGFIEKDLGKDVLLKPFADSLKIDGGIYEVYPDFTIYSFVGLKSVVGGPEDWTVERLISAYAALPEGAGVFSEYGTKEDVLSFLLSGCMEDYVNFKDGKCYFDSEEFISVLRFVSGLEQASAESERPGDRLENGEQLLYNSYIFNLGFYAAVNSHMFSEEVSFVGYPTADGGKSMFVPGGGFAISAVSENKEGAWEFLRPMLTEEFQKPKEYSFPTNRLAFEKRIADDKEGTSAKENGYVFGYGVSFSEVSEVEKAAFMEFVNGMDRVARNESRREICMIVSEECAALFAGDRLAEDTAKAIQGRVNIYLNEKK